MNKSQRDPGRLCELQPGPGGRTASAGLAASALADHELLRGWS